MDEGRSRTRTHCLNTASTAHNRLLQRGGFTQFRLLSGHEPLPPGGEPKDPEREGLELKSYMAKQTSAYKTWLEAERELRESRAQAQQHKCHALACWCRQVWSGSTGIHSGWTHAHEKERLLLWCSVKSADAHRKVICPSFS